MPCFRRKKKYYIAGIHDLNTKDSTGLPRTVAAGNLLSTYINRSENFISFTCKLLLYNYMKISY
jgi:hypothetical protein